MGRCGGFALALAIVAATETTAQTGESRRRVDVLQLGSLLPVAGAMVVNVDHGDSSATTGAGRTWIRRDRPAARIVVRKIGFVPETLSVALGSGDTATVVVLLRSIAALAAQTTVAEAMATYEHKLRSVGFLERQRSSAAPRSAFVTAADIERWRPALLSDVFRRTGRGLSGCRTYIDGTVVQPAGGRGNNYRRGLDALVKPSEVAAMEIYRRAEAPPAYSGTTRGGEAECTVLIWLR